MKVKLAKSRSSVLAGPLLILLYDIIENVNYFLLFLILQRAFPPCIYCVAIFLSSLLRVHAPKPWQFVRCPGQKIKCVRRVSINSPVSSIRRILAILVERNESVIFSIHSHGHKIYFINILKHHCWLRTCPCGKISQLHYLFSFNYSIRGSIKLK